MSFFFVHKILKNLLSSLQILLCWLLVVYGMLVLSENHMYKSTHVFSFQAAVAVPRRPPDAVLRDTTSLNQVRSADHLAHDTALLKVWTHYTSVCL